MTFSPIEHTASLRIGSVEYVSPDEIKICLDIEAPEGVSANAGIPRVFPRINSYVLIAAEAGYVVAQIEWIAIEKTPFPKRKGFQDYGLVDLPYPTRKMRANPLGLLKATADDRFEFQRGIQSFPSIGEPVLIPTDTQLKAIIESGKNRRIKIGISPVAANAEVRVDPDRLFGRHLAVLGNTGSGKSCSVAGLIQWSLTEAGRCKHTPNARFIIIDPNGEYSRVFCTKKSKHKARIFKVDDQSLKVPLWFWNSSEWSGITQASSRAQRPLLQTALRNRRNMIDVGTASSEQLSAAQYLRGAYSAIKFEIDNGSPYASSRDGRYWGFLELLSSFSESLRAFAIVGNDSLDDLSLLITDIKDNRCKNERGYNKPLTVQDTKELLSKLNDTITIFGCAPEGNLPLHEDVPIPFKTSEFIADLNFHATNSGNRQWVDTLITRISTLLANPQLINILEDNAITLKQWLTDYIGDISIHKENVVIIDLSLVPAEIIHIVAAVISRIIFEALQRYHRFEHMSLPTVLVMEEAHTFIKRYKEDTENHDAAYICCQIFEKIAREGRKFGLGLVLSSQRPSELSPTVLSQCNTFLLHRISNDKDQDLVSRLVPDNLRGLLRELPSLPSQNAILLGWASELPIMVRMNDLSEDERPHSDDPDFWDVWTGKDKDDKIIERIVDWQKIADDWQGKDIKNHGTNDEMEPDVKG